MYMYVVVKTVALVDCIVKPKDPQFSWPLHLNIFY